MFSLCKVGAPSILNNARYLHASGTVKFNFPPNNNARNTPSSNKGGLNLSLNLKEPIKPRSDVGSVTSSDSIKVVEPRFMKQFNSESIYDPFDFSLARINLDKKSQQSNKPLKKINPLDLYLSPDILSKYVSSTGKILHRDVTGLSPKDQRLISKAIRRCQAIGLMSKTSNNYNR
ncbi:small ribosomal subunit protein bS18m [Monosporozyma servazzii]